MVVCIFGGVVVVELGEIDVCGFYFGVVGVVYV